MANLRGLMDELLDPDLHAWARDAWVSLTVTEVDGEGDNPLLVAEVSIPGLELRRVARLPLSTWTAAAVKIA